MVKIKFNAKQFYSRMLILSILFNIGLFGSLLNLYVVSANGGKMPVYTNDMFVSDDKHFLFNETTSVNAYALTDNKRIDVGDFMVLYYSTGDVIIVVSGFFMLAYCIAVFSVGMYEVYLLLFKKRRKKKKRR